MSGTVMTPLIADHEAWLAQRQKGLGGSDIAAIIGLSPWTTPIDVWMQKTGRAGAKEETAAMHWGHNLESVIADEYARVTGNMVMPGVHLVNGCRVGNTDGMVPGQKRILEVKTASPFAAKDWGEPGTDEIPEYYLTQVQWYLGLLPEDEYEGADVPVLIGGNDFRIYKVDRNPDLISQLTEYGETWWKKYVDTDEAPPTDGTVEDLRSRILLHPADDGTMLASTADIDSLARELAEAREAMKGAEAQVEALELQLKNIIGDSSGIKGSDWSCTWKASKPSRKTDWEAACMKAGVSPAIIDECTSIRPGSRRFLFKPKF